MLSYFWDILGPLTMIGIIVCLLSFLIAIAFLYERDSNAAIARSPIRRMMILVTGVGFFISVGLGLQNVPGAIGLTFWFLAANVLLGGLRVALSPAETLFPSNYDLE